MSQDSVCSLVEPPLARSVPHHKQDPSELTGLQGSSLGSSDAADVPSPASRTVPLKALARAAKRVIAGLQQQLLGLKRARRVARYKQALAGDPENTTLLALIAHLHEVGGEPEAAGEWYRHLSSVYRAKGDTDGVEFCYRKLDHLQHPEPARFYRDLTTLYTRAGHHERAGRTSRRVVDLYVGGGHRSAAVGYLRGLPQGGAQRGYATSELRRLLKSPAPPPSQAAARPVFEGALGRDAIRDVARLAESEVVTGRLELVSGGTSGVIRFRSGRIVAARLDGELAGPEALEGILALDSGRYEFVRDVCPDVDEFAGQDTALLLADLAPERDNHAGEHDVKFVFSY